MWIWHAPPTHARGRCCDIFALPQAAAGGLSALETRDMAAQPHLRMALDDVRRDLTGKGRAGLADDVKRRIADMAAPLQVRLGYEPTGVDPRS